MHPPRFVADASGGGVGKPHQGCSHAFAARGAPPAILLLVIALGVRILAGWWLGHFAHPVAWEHERIAKNLLEGNGFLYMHLGTPYRAYLLPVYPSFCALVYGFTGHSQTALLLLQCLISAFACLQIRAIGALAFQDLRIAGWGSWLLAFHPGLVFYASSLHSLTLDLFAFLWVLWIWIKLFQEPTWRRALHAGLASGFALLSRGTIAPFLLFAMGLFLCSPGIPRQRAIQWVGLVLLIAGVLVTPWLVRNAIWLHRFPVFVTSSGQSFWQGNNPFASGSAHLPDGRPVLATLTEVSRRQLSGLDEFGQSQFFQQEAWRFIREHPREALRLYGRKFLAFWWFSPQTGLKYPSFYTRWYRWYYLGIVVMALVGFFRVRRRLWQGPLILMMGLGFSVAAFQSIYYVEGRHRWTVEPLFLLFTALGAIALWERLAQRIQLRWAA